MGIDLDIVVGFFFVFWVGLFGAYLAKPLMQKIRCKMGVHKHTETVRGRRRISYRCAHCYEPLGHLRVIDGGKKDGIGKNTFKW